MKHTISVKGKGKAENDNMSVISAVSNVTSVI
jgi:hypothetical protein